MGERSLHTREVAGSKPAAPIGPNRAPARFLHLSAGCGLAGVVPAGRKLEAERSRGRCQRGERCRTHGVLDPAPLTRGAAAAACRTSADRTHEHTPNPERMTSCSRAVALPLRLCLELNCAGSHPIVLGRLHPGLLGASCHAGEAPQRSCLSLRSSAVRCRPGLAAASKALAHAVGPRRRNDR